MSWQIPRFFSESLPYFMHSSSSDLCRNFVFFLYYLRAHCSWAVSTFGPSELRVGRNHVEKLEITVVYVLCTWDWGIKKYWIIFQLSPWRRPDTLSESWVSKQSVDTGPQKNLMLKISGCGAFQNFSPFSVSRREKSIKSLSAQCWCHRPST